MINGNLRDVWPEWQIVRQIGRGSYGVVYEAVRRNYSIESHAAIKVISIPQNESEVNELRSEGMSEDSAKTYLENVVNDFSKEIALLESFKGIQNIVDIEDYKVVEKESGIGWDIYIRMELLTPFDSYICDRNLTEPEVIKVGVDICTALEFCAKKNVIHRDVKPGNIFVNQFGDFKLGDFGIARKLENVTGGFSYKGTYNYMAPEIEKGMQYDATVDLYSLGLVLYRLMNRKLFPFLNTEQQSLSPNERAAANRRRMDGEPLPAPCDASPAMAQVILRACSPDAWKRFSTATEMKSALISVANGTYREEDTVLEKTKRVRPIEQKQDQGLDATMAVRKKTYTQKAVGTFAEKSESERFNGFTVLSLVFALAGLAAACFLYFQKDMLLDKIGSDFWEKAWDYLGFGLPAILFFFGVVFGALAVRKQIWRIFSGLVRILNIVSLLVMLGCLIWTGVQDYRDGNETDTEENIETQAEENTETQTEENAETQVEENAETQVEENPIKIERGEMPAEIENKEQPAETQNHIMLEQSVEMQEYHRFMGHYYKLFNMKEYGISNWDELVNYCNSLGGYPATINTLEENTDLYSWIRESGLLTAFFGYTDQENEGEWSWVNSDGDYVNWGIGQPNNTITNSHPEGENYAQFWVEAADGTWNDIHFKGNTAAFICEWDSAEKIVPAAQTVNADIIQSGISRNMFSDSVISYEGHIYTVFNYRGAGIKDWNSLCQFLESENGYPATIDSAEENQMLYQYIKDSGYITAYFGYVKQNGIWQWLKGDSSYSNWASGQPNNTISKNQPEGEKYVQFFKDETNGTWNDVPFGINTDWVLCEWDSVEDYYR